MKFFLRLNFRIDSKIEIISVITLFVLSNIKMFPLLTLPVDTVLLHATSRKTQQEMDYLEMMRKESETSLRWKTLLAHYEQLGEREFPTSLQHPKWFSLPLHMYDGDVILKYKLLRPLRLVDLRSFSDEHGTSPNNLASDGGLATGPGTGQM